MGTGSVDTVIRRVGEEIHLHTHYTHREKARSVPGAKWNVDKRAWVYPLSKNVYIQLRDLFGSHAEFEGFEAPLREKNSPDVAVLQREVERLRRDLEVKTQQNAEFHESQRSFLEQLRQLNKDLYFTGLEKRRLEDELEKERRKWRIPTKKKPSDSLVDQAAALSDGAITLKDILEDAGFENAGLHVCSRLELMLRASLDMQSNEDERVSLIDLIREAQKNFDLDKQTTDVLHFLRTNRNILAHSTLPQREQWLRNAMSVCAASIVWRRIELMTSGK